jgi:hypothetical protein
MSMTTKTIAEAINAKLMIHQMKDTSPSKAINFETRVDILTFVLTVLSRVASLALASAHIANTSILTRILAGDRVN